MSIEARIDTLCDTHPAVGWLLENGADVKKSTFLSDVRSRLLRFGVLSDRQIAAIQKCRDSAGRLNEDNAKRAALVASGVKAPEGDDVDVVGEIVSVKPSRYGFGAVVNTDAGWRCWFRLPAALLRECDALDARGRRVQFRATVSRSQDDPLFGFAKRPSNASFA